MEKKLPVKFLIGFMLLQQNIINTHELPLDTPNVNISINEEHLWIPGELKQLGDDYFNDIKSLPRYLNIRPKTEKNHTYDTPETLYIDLEARRIMHVVDSRRLKTLCNKVQHVYGVLDLIFMLSVLIVFCFHIFFLDVFIRFTRTRFDNSNRYLLLSNINRILSFLMCVVCFLLLLMHYRESEL